MADTKISELPSAVSVAADDLVPIVVDPFGAPATEAASVGQLRGPQMMVVEHGGDPFTPRPDAVQVYWRGQANPRHARAGDLWTDGRELRSWGVHGWTGAQRIIDTKCVMAVSAGEYDPELDALVDLSGHGHHARLGSSVGPDTNDPLRLRGPGVYFAGPGPELQRVSTPWLPSYSDRALDLVARITPTSWTVAEYQSIMAVNSGGGRSWQWRLYSGSMHLVLEGPGGNFQNEFTRSIPDFGAGVARWLRLTYDPDTGVGRVYQHPDTGSNAPPSYSSPGWGQVGPDYTGSPTELYTSGSPSYLEIGARAGGNAQNFGGVIHYVSYAGVVGGPPEVVMDPTGVAYGAGSWRSHTGEVWSTEGADQWIVDRPQLLLDGVDDYLEVAHHPDLNADPAAFTALAVYRGLTPDGAARAVLTKRTSVGSAATPVGWTLHLGSGGAAVARVADGAAVASANVTPPPIGTLVAHAMTMDGADLTEYVNGASASSVLAGLGPTSNPSAVRVGATAATPTDLLRMVLIGAAIAREALTPAEIQQLAYELGGD